jgi:hypothetical protein
LLIFGRGWDQTGSNGANLSFPEEFGIGAGSKPLGTPNHDRDNWLVGLVNAAPYIGSALMYVAARVAFQCHSGVIMQTFLSSCSASADRTAADVGSQIP